MKTKIFISLLIISSMMILKAQNDYIKGFVMEEKKDGSFSPIPFANIYWADTLIGTTTDSIGFFNIPHFHPKNALVIKYVGYETDTVEINDHQEITIILKNSQQLDEVKVIYKKNTTEISFIKPIKIEEMQKEELYKAACCNLSESFETNPSIDVNYSDAVTGTKEISMLGLAGKYVQISKESMPFVRGLMSNYGLTYIPGSWVEGIQVSKGAGSVINGFESMVGQINIELKKPRKSEKLFVNGYINQEGRYEMNMNTAINLGEHASTAILAHGSDRYQRVDNNGDGFMDFPVGRQVNLMNRWYFDNNKGLKGQIGIHYLDDNKVGGQIDFDESIHKLDDQVYGLGINTSRIDIWTKTGYVFANKKYKSFGLQLNYSQYEQDTYIGLRDYEGLQKTYYANFIYQTIISNTDHKIKTGMSYLNDEYNERLDTGYSIRSEAWPGVFAEYTYTGINNITLLAAMRVDNDERLDNVISPRLHLLYTPHENWVFRFSSGRGMRSANILPEVMKHLISSRKLVFVDKHFLPELVWNYGVNLSYRFRNGHKNGMLSLDVFRTDFENQLIIDLEKSYDAVYVYNMDKLCYSNSIQTQFDYELIENLNMRLAYRWFDVYQNYEGIGQIEAPLVAKHRGFLNLSYKTYTEWMFDATLQWVGNKRIPYYATYSNEYFMVMAQVTKNFADHWSVYLGCENITNFTQKSPIISADQPFDDNFDASLVWGPIYGRMFYFGFRYNLK